jgi:hypothetical protein
MGFNLAFKALKVKRETSAGPRAGIDDLKKK